ncbi:DUF559 domain-containing protein [Sphingomonas sp. S1-29]|uniref:endonuclease domain-containing protein n=1 Tax=Sphingomonas sp. S1-29 TaxID=2991074 RepID=UPI00223F6437|nr:DUF559 domain-containing protein [Sphingomonas sp. S1-29]UZK68714.1 DUF559 domain-containing protein [Sphingomonas sp. S1-29]
MPAIRPTNPHARTLRLNATDAEKRFWNAVRNRQLGGFKFRRQVTIGPYIADFVCAERHLIVELDGGQHGDAADATRTAYLRGCGYEIIRFWNNDVIGNIEGVLVTLLSHLEADVPVDGPSPNPLPQAGEG